MTATSNNKLGNSPITANDQAITGGEVIEQKTRQELAKAIAGFARAIDVNGYRETWNDLITADEITLAAMDVVDQAFSCDAMDLAETLSKSVPYRTWLVGLIANNHLESHSPRSSPRLLSPRVNMTAQVRISAGLLMYRIKDGKLQVLLAHPGGPLFKKKDDGAWSIPKGEVEGGEDLLECAKREFEEETAISPAGPLIALKPVTQKGGKIVHAWAFEGDCDPSAIVSNSFTMEWPPRSGRQKEFPEIDRAEFFDVAAARWKIKAAQMALIEELEGILDRTS